MGGAAVTILFGFVFFPLLDTKSPALIVLASVVGLCCHAAMWGPLAAFLPEMFETRVRCTGASLSFQLAGIFGNAPAPLIATQLLLIFNSPWPAAFYMSAFLLLVIFCVRLAPETVHANLASITASRVRGRPAVLGAS
jgi:MFS family permease